jgi:hypothetical protein
VHGALHLPMPVAEVAAHPTSRKPPSKAPASPVRFTSKYSEHLAPIFDSSSDVYLIDKHLSRGTLPGIRDSNTSFNIG